VHAHVFKSNLPLLKHGGHVGLFSHVHLFGHILITKIIEQSKSAHSFGSGMLLKQLNTHEPPTKLNPGGHFAN